MRKSSKWLLAGAVGAGIITAPQAQAGPAEPIRPGEVIIGEPACDDNRPLAIIGKGSDKDNVILRVNGVDYTKKRDDGGRAFFISGPRVDYGGTVQAEVLQPGKGTVAIRTVTMPTAEMCGVK